LSFRFFFAIIQKPQRGEVSVAIEKGCTSKLCRSAISENTLRSHGAQLNFSVWRCVKCNADCFMFDRLFSFKLRSDAFLKSVASVMPKQAKSLIFSF